MIREAEVHEGNHSAKLIIDKNESEVQMWLSDAESSARFFGAFASMAKVHQ